MIEANAKGDEVAVLLATELGDGEFTDRLDVAELVPDFVEVALRKLSDVLATVAVFR